jgi:hypothetical protein
MGSYPTFPKPRILIKAAIARMGKRAHKPGTDRVGKHLGVYRNQFEKWMDGLMEWEATEKQCPASILKTAC